MSARAAKDLTGSSSLFRRCSDIPPFSARNARFALLGKRAVHREHAREQRRGTRKHFVARSSLARRNPNKPS